MNPLDYKRIRFDGEKYRIDVLTDTWETFICCDTYKEAERYYQNVPDFRQDSAIEKWYDLYRKDVVQIII